MKRTRWGIIGPGTIAHNFADGMGQARSGKLVAIASRSAVRRTEFGDAYGIAGDRRYDSYAALVADPDIDAVYIATPHPWHAELSLLAMRAGKAVLCEKPAGMNAAEVVTLTEAAAQEGVFFMEAYMYRCHPQIARMIEILRSGEIGEIQHIDARFGFSVPRDPDSRLFDPALGGGGILDVGGYPVSFARLVAGIASGEPFADPVTLKGAGIMGPTGVDEVAFALMTFDNGVTAEVACAVHREMVSHAKVIGSKGTMTLFDPWIPGKEAGPSDTTIEVSVDGANRVEEIRCPEQLYAFEAELASRAIADGALQPPWPAMTHADGIANNRTLDRWRRELGYATFADRAETNRPLPRSMPPGLPQIPAARITGVDQPVSRLVIGADNPDDLASAAIVWDAWVEAGGNTFDTAFVYNDGGCEALLGQWMRSRGVADRMVVIVKGAHTPYSLPQAVAPQLDQSLDRLGLDKAPLYILHRDNPDIPVGEFIEVLNDLHRRGRIGAFGASNWSVERFVEANDYANDHGLQPFTVLNNNLSLATMEHPVWPGCVSANTPETLEFLRKTGTPHLGWSAQARGYFAPGHQRHPLPEGTDPETCFGGDANAERRRRATQLAKELGVTAQNVATAWVLGQPFPSFALVGPRSAGQIASTLPALRIDLTPRQIAWLNLAEDTGH